MREGKVWDEEEEHVCKVSFICFSISREIIIHRLILMVIESKGANDLVLIIGSKY